MEFGPSIDRLHFVGNTTFQRPIEAGLVKCEFYVARPDRIAYVEFRENWFNAIRMDVMDFKGFGNVGALCVIVEIMIIVNNQANPRRVYTNNQNLHKLKPL